MNYIVKEACSGDYVVRLGAGFADSSCLEAPGSPAEFDQAEAQRVAGLMNFDGEDTTRAFDAVPVRDKN